MDVVEKGLAGLLEAEAHNAAESRRALCAMFPSFEDLIDDTISLHSAIAEDWGTNAGYAEAQRKMDRWAKESHLGGKVALELLSNAALIGGDSNDSFAQAQAGHDDQLTCLARYLLWSKLEKEFLFGLADLLRGRAGHSVGVGRLQAETAGVLMWLTKDSGNAKLWWKSQNSRGGAKFHRQQSRAINECMKALGLYHAYEWGSGMAQHPRAESMGLGMIAGSRSVGGVSSKGYAYHDIWNPEHLLVWVALFMRLTRRVLSKSALLLPELSGSKWHELGAHRFWRLEDRLWTQCLSARARRRRPFDFAE